MHFACSIETFVLCYSHVVQYSKFIPSIHEFLCKLSMVKGISFIIKDMSSRTAFATFSIIFFYSRVERHNMMPLVEKISSAIYYLSATRFPTSVSFS
jgi:hypothetical protein